MKYLRALPVEVTTYNIGLVGSIAAVAFLGARNRRANARCSFMTHEVRIEVEGLPTSAELGGFSQQAFIDEQAVETILKAALTLDASEWEKRRRGELWFNASDAKKVGFVQEVQDFAPPLKTIPYPL